MTSRTLHGLRMVRPGGNWQTEDGRYKIIRVLAYTECEHDHPMPIGVGLAQAAREATTSALCGPGRSCGHWQTVDAISCARPVRNTNTRLVGRSTLTSTATCSRRWGMRGPTWLDT
jgi:hypothetical protein